MSSLLSCDPVGMPPRAADLEIVVMLFDRAVAALTRAIEHCRRHQIEARFEALAEAGECIGTLAEGLDPEARDAWSRQTAALYSGALSRIALANVRNDEGKAEQVMVLLEPLRLSWRTLLADARLREAKLSGVAISLAAPNEAGLAAD